MLNLEVRLQTGGKRLTAWCYRSRWPFLVALLAGLAVHYVIYAYHLQNFDSLHVGSLYMADQWDFSPRWETQQGRWGLFFVDWLRGGINLAPLSSFLLLLFFAAAGMLLTRLFAVRSTALRYLIPLLLVCAPYTAEVETYHYCSAAYALSFLLAVLAVMWPACTVSRWGWLPGAVCLLLSLSLYQASLGVAAGLCLMVLVLTVLRQPQQPKALLPLAAKLLAMGLAGAVGYSLALRFFLRLYDVSLAGINGINLVGAEWLTGLPAGVANAYRDFFRYFATHEIAQNYYGQRAAYLLLLLLTVLLVVRWLLGRYAAAGKLVAVVLLLLLPAAVNVTDVINPNTQIELRMAGGLVLIAPFCLALWEAAGLRRDDGRRFAVLAVGSVLTLVLLRGYIVQVNNDAMAMLAQKNTIVHLADRICTTLESDADYQAGAQVCILGQPQKGTYDDLSPLQEKSSDLVQFGLLSFDPTYNSRGWHSLYWEELGLRLNWCSDEETRKICATDTFQNMPVYPQEGSIQTIDGVVTVKVAPIQ